MAYLWETHLAVEDGEFEPYYHQRPRSEVLSVIPRPPRRFLDIGCGAGATGAMLKSRYTGAYGIGVELNRRAAEAARGVLDLVLCGDIADGRLLGEQVAPSSIDTVLLLDVLEHVYNPWQLLRALRPWLTDDAQIIASIPNIFNLQVFEELASGHWRYEQAGLLDITHIRFFTLREMTAMFEQTGYVVQKVGAVQHPPHLLPKVVARHPDGIETDRVRLKNLTPPQIQELVHGQFLVVAAPKAASPKAALVSAETSEQVLARAQEHYSRGELAAARSLADRVMASDPANAAGLQLLGLIAYAANDLRHALAHLQAAQQLLGEAHPGLQANLAAVNLALTQSDAMREIDRRALPSLRHRLRDPAATPPVPAADMVHLIVDLTIANAALSAERFAAACARAGQAFGAIWTTDTAPIVFSNGATARVLDGNSIHLLRGSAVLVWGAWPTFGHFVDRCDPARVIVLTETDAADRVIATVNYAATLGGSAVELVCTSAAIRETLGLPARTLDQASNSDGLPLKDSAIDRLIHQLFQTE